MLSSPLTLLRTLTAKSQQRPSNIGLLLNKQIDQLRKKLKTYPSKEKKLINLMSHEAVTKDYVLEALTKLKQERLNDERQLQSLLVSRKESTHADHLRLQLSSLSFNKIMDLLYEPEEQENTNTFTGDIYPLNEQQLASQLSRRRSLFEAIHLKVLADPQSYNFNFTLDGRIISTTDSDELSSFTAELEEFEKQHPDILVQDLLDTNKLLPEDTPFAKTVNKAKKNLVTTGQTSA